MRHRSRTIRAAMTPVWDGSAWVASLPLPEWSRWRSPERPTEVPARFVGGGLARAPEAPHRAVAARLVDTHARLVTPLSLALRRHYLLRRPDFRAYAQTNATLFAELTAQLPPDPDEAQLDALHRLDAITVHEDGAIGLVYWASWAPDDHVGVLLRGLAVTAVGDAATATGLDSGL